MSENEVVDRQDALSDGEDNASDNIVFVSKVNLEKVEVSGGEEEEEVLLKVRSKLFVFVAQDVYGGETRKNFWKERGTGDVKLLKHREHKKVRLLMRQEKTLKICANHLISPGVVLTPNVGNDRSFVFTAMDYADEELVQQTFAIRFNSVENATRFKSMVELAKKANGGEMNPDELKPDTGDEVPPVDSAIEAAIDEHNKDVAEIRQSVSVEGAKDDSEVDSQTEDVVEGDDARLKATFGVSVDDDTEKISTGLSKVDIETATAGGFKLIENDCEEVKATAKFAAEAIGNGTLHEIVEAAKQVVAGINYRLKLKIKHSSDGSLQLYSATVFQPLPHTKKPLELTHHAHFGSA